jgi:hypothetical protein
MADNNPLNQLRTEMNGAVNAVENAIASLRQPGKLTEANVKRVGKLIGDVESIITTALTGVGTGENHKNGVRDFRRAFDNMVETASAHGLFTVDRIRAKSSRKAGAGRKPMTPEQKVLAALGVVTGEGEE